VLVVTALILVLSIGGGSPPGEEVGEYLFFPTPKENVLPEPGLRRKPGRADGWGGTGISPYDFCPAFCLFLSGLVSIEEGFVDEVLSRAEEEALSL
jgi:hypothetical protein